MIPSGASGGTVILKTAVSGTLGCRAGRGGALTLGSGGGGGTSSALKPGELNRSFSGSSKSTPATVASTTVPALPPAGKMLTKRGAG